MVFISFLFSFAIGWCAGTSLSRGIEARQEGNWFYGSVCIIFAIISFLSVFRFLWE